MKLTHERLAVIDAELQNVIAAVTSSKLVKAREYCLKVRGSMNTIAEQNLDIDRDKVAEISGNICGVIAAVNTAGIPLVPPDTATIWDALSDLPDEKPLE
jgi:hypothetical protein